MQPKGPKAQRVQGLWSLCLVRPSWSRRPKGSSRIGEKGAQGPQGPGQHGQAAHHFWAPWDEPSAPSAPSKGSKGPLGPLGPGQRARRGRRGPYRGAEGAEGSGSKGPKAQRVQGLWSLCLVRLRAWLLGPCTVCCMAEPWENMTDADAARLCGSMLSDLDARIRAVAHARCEAVHRLRAGGMSVRRICDELSLSRWTVCHILKTEPQRSMAATPPNTP
jgi:hypothetical protein